MPQPNTPIPQRMVTTDELQRFVQCPLAWWYDRTHPFAQASAEELARRLTIFQAVYGPSARDLPEYRLLAHLHAQATGQRKTSP